jgi:putative DNA primase/helicase
MTAAEFDRIWACVQAVEPTIDVATRDASRFWYWPGSQHPQYARCVIALGGRRIDPDADFVSQPLARAVAAIQAAPPGQRNHTLNSQAFAVARQLHATPAALEILATAARAAGLDEREISRTIQSATTAVQRPQSTDDAHVFDRGDHVEIADRIQAIMPPLAHDGLQFYAYDAGVWRALHVSQIAMTVQSLAGALVRSQSGAVRKLNMTSGMIDGVQKILAGRAYRDFSAAPAGVTFRNTRLAIHDGAVYQCQPTQDDLERHCVDFDYNPEADCPRFDRMITDIFGSMDDTRAMILQEFAGASLFVQATRYQRAVILLGSGGNGKSQLITAIGAAFPLSSVAALPAESWGNDFMLAGLVGKRINLVNEMPARESVASERFKNVITGERLQINVKYKDPVSSALIAGHLFAANSLPQTSDLSAGYFRRLIVISMDRRFDTAQEVDFDIGRHIAENERAGVAAWAVRGMQRLLAAGAYTHDDRSADVISDWETGSDSVRAFYVSELEPSTTTRMGARELYRDYSQWAREGGFQPVNERNFSQRMARCGVQKSTISGRMQYLVQRK